MNDYIKKAFNLCTAHQVWFCGVRSIFDEGALCRFELLQGEQIPFNAEVYGDCAKLEEGHTVNVSLALFMSDGRGSVFRDEEKFRREKKNRLAVESIIPFGTFPVSCNVGHFKESAHVLLTGRIVSLQKVVLDKIKNLHIGLRCLGVVYDFFIEENALPFCEVGNILSAMFFILCKIKELNSLDADES